MSEYVLSCCSTVDLTPEHMQRRNLAFACFRFKLDGKDYTDDLGQTMKLSDFYAAMQAGADTSTSQINTGEYLDYFSRFLEQGKDVLHVCLSSGLSGSYNSANSAALIARERYPERKVYIVDSLAASSGFGLLMDTAADMRDSGMTIDELRDWLEREKLRVHHWFFSTDLTFYIKGGRVTKTSGAIGMALGICPLLHVDKLGRLIPMAKVRTKKRVTQEIVRRMVQHAENGTDYSGKCYISHSACEADALEVKRLVEQTFPKLEGKVEIYDIGTTIGSHSGPGTVALFFWGDSRGEA